MHDPCARRSRPGTAPSSAATARRRSALGRRVAERVRAAVRRLGRASADAQLQTATAEQIGCGRVLRHVERVLVPHVDHGGADLDPARPDADRGEERERRRQLAGEVMHPDERAVDAELLGGDRELDRLKVRVARGARQRPVGRLPMAEREEADALPVASCRVATSVTGASKQRARASRGRRRRRHRRHMNEAGPSPPPAAAIASAP